MKREFFSVIDKDGYYVTYILAEVHGDEVTPYEYTLKPNEKLVRLSPPNGVRCKLIGDEWKETATNEEIEVYRKQEAENAGREWPPREPEPTTQDLLLETTLDHEARISLIEITGGMA